MNNQEQQNRQNEGGSGSAENTGQGRKAQQHSPSNLTENEKNRIADEADTGKVPVAGIQETGALSGRDDAAGGSNDGMTDTSTGRRTDKF